MFGRDLRLPIDLQFGHPEEGAQFATDYALNLQETVQQVHYFARSHLTMRSARMKQRYDAAVHGRELSVGDAVWTLTVRRESVLS